MYEKKIVEKVTQSHFLLYSMYCHPPYIYIPFLPLPPGTLLVPSTFDSIFLPDQIQSSRPDTESRSLILFTVTLVGLSED